LANNLELKIERKIMTVILAIAFLALIFFAVYGALWAIWGWVLPQIWPTGPENLIDPSFWLFVAVCFLIQFVGRLIFGSKAKSE
jgi:uncharacterized membrane protein YGL010W